MEQAYFMRVWAWLAGFAASGSVNRADIWLTNSMHATLPRIGLISAFVDVAAKDAGCSIGPSLSHCSPKRTSRINWTQGWRP
jgi:hypothetical protein